MKLHTAYKAYYSSLYMWDNIYDAKQNADT